MGFLRMGHQEGGLGKQQLLGHLDSGPRRVLVAAGRQYGYKLLNRESTVSLTLHQRAWET